jgi:hypothetical protein
VSTIDHDIWSRRRKHAVPEGVKAMPDVDVLLYQIARAKGAAAMIDTAIRKRFELMVAELQRSLAAIEQHPVSQRDND